MTLSSNIISLTSLKITQTFHLLLGFWKKSNCLLEFKIQSSVRISKGSNNGIRIMEVLLYMEASVFLEVASRGREQPPWALPPKSVIGHFKFVMVGTKIITRLPTTFKFIATTHLSPCNQILGMEKCSIYLSMQSYTQFFQKCLYDEWWQFNAAQFYHSTH